MRRLLIFGLLVLAGCGEDGPGEIPPHELPSPEQVGASLAGLSFDAFIERSYLELVRRSPETTAELSLRPEEVARLDDLTPAFAAETDEVLRVVQDILQTYDLGALSADQQLTYEVYDWYLDDRRRAHMFADHRYVATQMLNGEPTSTEVLFTEILPMGSEADAQAYVDRLWRVDDKFAQLDALVRERAARGFVPPKMMLGWMQDRTAAVAFGETSAAPYLVAFRAKLAKISNLDDDRRTELDEAATRAVEEAVIPAYASLSRTFGDLRRDARESLGASTLPNGAAYYAETLRHHTTTASTAEQIHARGLAELDRIHTELRLHFEALGYPAEESIATLLARAADEGGIVESRDVLSTYTEIIARAEERLDEAFDILPSSDVVVIGVRFGGYYIGPSLDGTRPGAFYAGTASEARFGMRTLAYHEAVPGHHLQIGIARDLDLPFFRRVTNHTAYVEGWALYAERLAADLGWYEDDPYGDIGRLQAEAFRAARLVVDTGIHAMEWDFDRATRFFEDNAGFSRTFAQGQVARYIAWPGQATAYATGMARILALRARAQAALGEDFDLRAFHRVVLTSGSVPLPVLERRIDEWIAQ